MERVRLSAWVVARDISDGARDEIEGSEAIDEAVSLIFGELSGTYRKGSDPALELFLEPFELCFEWVDSSYGSSAVQSLIWSTRSLTILNFNRKSISSEQFWYYIFHKNKIQ